MPDEEPKEEKDKDMTWDRKIHLLTNEIEKIEDSNTDEIRNTQEEPIETTLATDPIDTEQQLEEMFEEVIQSNETAASAIPRLVMHIGRLHPNWSRHAVTSYLTKHLDYRWAVQTILKYVFVPHQGPRGRPKGTVKQLQPHPNQVQERDDFLLKARFCPWCGKNL